MGNQMFDICKSPRLGKTIAHWICTLFHHSSGPIILLAACVILFLIVAVIVILIALISAHYHGVAVSPDTLRWLYLSITAMIAALGALLAIPFTIIRVWQSERQTKTAEEGVITDRITKAIEQLGAEKTVNVETKKEPIEEGSSLAEQVKEEVKAPNLELRLGAILALERLAMEKEPVRIEVLKLLASYIRLNSSRKAYPFRQDEWLDGQNGVRVSAVNSLAAPWPDIQAACEVIGRLVKASSIPDGHQVELRNANLQRVDLNGLCLKDARLHGADLRGGGFYKTDFTNCNMAGANLAYADFRGADLTNVTLVRANARGADFSDAPGLNQEQVNALFGDAATKLPNGLRRTTELNHAPLENPSDNDQEFKRWKDAGYPLGVPLDDP